MDSPRAWVGTSGWSYDHWNGVLYPAGTRQADRLAVYVQEFPTVELNASFYRWPSDAMFASWRDRLPPGFRMSVKASRWLTHGRRLLHPEPWIERIARAWRLLGDRAGMLLVQLPPDLEREDKRLAVFMEQMAAADPRVPLAFEFRHPTWQHEEVYDLLQHYGAAYVVMSGAGLPCILRSTAEAVFVRLHGPDDRHLYAGSYSDQDLAWWAERIREWLAQGHTVYAYFNNDGGGNAVRNARTLQRLLA